MKTLVSGAIGAAIGTVLALVLIPAIGQMVDNAQPPERWLEISGLTAFDTQVGMSPVVTAERTINRSMLAKTRVTLRRRDDETGLWEPVCSRTTERHFIPQSKLPDPVTLDYWSEAPPNPRCVPQEPGVHIVSLWVEINGDAGARTAPIDLMSNEFSVTEAAP